MALSTPDAGYPFAAVVGQDQLRLALILNAVSPRIGGVVVRGEKGTAKTTTVRAFAALLGGAPLVNLPIGATEDRVVGSLDVETVLTTGRAEYHPGLLAQADGGVLYVDEVNLLADHLVDTLLDAAATGRVTIERDGISHSSPADFVLVGTMNPEEGELRPQLLDRFGLAVDVSASRDVEIRTEIIRRRLSYEADPVAFATAWAAEDADLSARIERARKLLPDVELSDTNLARIAHICASFDVDGMRADLVIARAAAACAAYRGDTAVTDGDIRTAAQLALPHRRRRDPFDEPGLDEDKLDETMDEARDQHPEQPEDNAREPEDNDPEPEDRGAEDNTPQDPPEQSEEPSEKPDADGKAGRAEQGAPFRSAGTEA
ncbi:AAA family ATPase [Corynebacterium meridianum]|uniref:AAA family ATPase n=1 Tax=Corynebacterium meridianum TaxID=2765363 RepID=UPI0020042711|nr:AAA family ATPase [Corynebacterium meridianum]